MDIPPTLFIKSDGWKNEEWTKLVPEQWNVENVQVIGGIVGREAVDEGCLCPPQNVH